jgi:signal transduction histidine kinase
VEVAVGEGDGAVDVRVADDGVGVHAASRSAPGFGLVGMRERVAMAGGELHVERGRSGGTVVRARLPIRA